MVFKFGYKDEVDIVNRPLRYSGDRRHPLNLNCRYTECIYITYTADFGKLPRSMIIQMKWMKLSCLFWSSYKLLPNMQRSKWTSRASTEWTGTSIFSSFMTIKHGITHANNLPRINATSRSAQRDHVLSTFAFEPVQETWNMSITDFWGERRSRKKKQKQK